MVSLINFPKIVTPLSIYKGLCHDIKKFAEHITDVSRTQLNISDGAYMSYLILQKAPS